MRTSRLGEPRGGGLYLFGRWTGGGSNPAGIIELAQGLAREYVTLRPSQKRQIVDSVFSKLRLDDAYVCGNYRLPFSILTQNSSRPLNSGWVDDFRTAVSIYPVALDLLAMS